MKKIIFCIVFIFLNHHLFAAQANKETTIAALDIASQNTTIKKVNIFLNNYDQLSNEDRISIRRDINVVKKLLKVDKSLLKGSPSTSLFFIQIRINNIFKINAEVSEKLNIDFSSYFCRDLNKSLKTLDEINNDDIVHQIVDCVSFVEGNSNKVLSYIRDQKLTSKKYFKYFKEKETD